MIEHSDIVLNSLYHSTKLVEWYTDNKTMPEFIWRPEMEPEQLKTPGFSLIFWDLLCAALLQGFYNCNVLLRAMKGCEKTCIIDIIISTIHRNLGRIIIKSRLELQIKILKDMCKVFFRNAENCMRIKNIPDSIHLSTPNPQSEHVHKLLSSKYALEWRSDNAYI